jgi:hypothetical protein
MRTKQNRDRVHSTTQVDYATALMETFTMEDSSMDTVVVLGREVGTTATTTLLCRPREFFLSDTK